MNPIPYVGDQALATAKWMEKKLRDVARSGGIIFISVRPVPALKGNSIVFEVRLGIDQEYEEETGMAVIKHVFDDQIKSNNINISAFVFRGIRGAAAFIENP